MNTQIKTWLGTAVIVVIALTAGMFIYYQQKIQPEVSQTEQIKNEANKINNFKTYSSERCNFSFNYPDNISDSDISINDTDLDSEIISLMRDKGTQDPLHEPVVCRILLYSTSSNKSIEILAIKPSIAQQAGFKNWQYSPDINLGPDNNDKLKNYSNVSKTNIVIGGISAIKYSYSEKMIVPPGISIDPGRPEKSEFQNYYFEKGNYIYVIKIYKTNNFDQNMLNSIDQILSTFKFTN